MNPWRAIFDPAPVRTPLDRRPDLDDATKARLMEMEPLGLQRLRVLDCIGGNDRFLGAPFSPTSDATLLQSFERYVLEAARRWSSEDDAVSGSNVAAARLLIGDLTGADVILDCLPGKPFELDHGAGRCLLAAVQALSAVLPLPPDLKDTDRWTAGSPEQAALRAWLVENRARLCWREGEGDYVLAVRRSTAAG